jgi:hypothetical protein
MLRILLVFFAIALVAQPPVDQAPDPHLPLPNNKREDELMKLDHKKNLEDSANMAKLAQEVNEEFEKDDRFVMSIKTLKNLDEIEHLAKAIRGRLKK